MEIQTLTMFLSEQELQELAVKLQPPDTPDRFRHGQALVVVGHQQDILADGCPNRSHDLQVGFEILIPQPDFDCPESGRHQLHRFRRRSRLTSPRTYAKRAGSTTWSPRRAATATPASFRASARSTS